MQHEKAESVKQGFALMLETACRDFEALHRLMYKVTKITSIYPNLSITDGAAINMALAKSFIFHVQRARRICERGSQYLNLERSERKKFLRATMLVSSVRDVNEHGFDVRKSGKDSSPKIHEHIDAEVRLDETSLVFTDGKLIMGPLDLYEIYKSTNEVRIFAGFGALSE